MSNLILWRVVDVIVTRLNKVPRHRENMFAITRFRYIEVLFHIFYYYWHGAKNIVRYNEDTVI